MNALLRQFFRDRVNENDKLIIAQISSANQGPIWCGSPKAFRARFGGKASFDDMLKQYKGASRVFDSITETIEYALPMMGKGKAGIFIYSDCQDNLSKPGGEERLAKAFKEFGAKGGMVGIYWCGFQETAIWRKHLQGSVKRFVVSSSIDADPPLPSWD